MNVASILPLAPTGTAVATTSEAPTGFLEVLAAQQPTGDLARDAGDPASDAVVPPGPEALGLASFVLRGGGGLLATTPLGIAATGDAASDLLPTDDTPTELPPTGTHPSTSADHPDRTGESVETQPGERAPASVTSARPATVDGTAEASGTTSVPDEGAGTTVSPAGSDARAIPGADTPVATDADGSPPSEHTPSAVRGGATAAEGAPDEPLPSTDAASRTTDARPSARDTAAAARTRGSADAAGARAATDTATLRVEGPGGVSSPVGGASGDRAGLAVPSATAQRVLDIVSQLEDAPPPRVVVIESGELRVRVGLDAGVVRLTVLGELTEAGDEVLREAADALEADGFGTELDRPDGGDPEERGAAADDGRAGPDVRPRPDPATTTTRPRAGLQL